ncbi:MAG: archaetidylserine decarboxylase, partial [Pseudomonadota bacterium]
LTNKLSPATLERGNIAFYQLRQYRGSPSDGFVSHKLWPGLDPKPWRRQARISVYADGVEVATIKALSWLMMKLTRLQFSGIAHWMIHQVVTFYEVDMTEAEEPDIYKYAHFNEFFTRALAADARPLAAQGVISPVDGEISQLGPIESQRLIQAKGHHYTLTNLFGGLKHVVKLFENGRFCTIYLSPRDYHRIHTPLTGKPVDMIYVPGRLFSVNQSTTRTVPGLFTRNERVISIFRTAHGPMAVIMVGAIFVGSIETVWNGVITPSSSRKIQHWQTPDNTRNFKRGEEIGRFNMGSTVILVFGDKQIEWLDTLAPGAKVKMGEQIGTLL